MTAVLLEGLALLGAFVVLFVLPALWGAWRIRREERRRPPLTNWEARRARALAEEREWRRSRGGD